ncbi:MAG: hypothetical protein ACTHLR_12880 [Rhizomicrobium sp.]
MRTLQISDATYAALWAKWEEGDEGEEGVIRKLLGLKDKMPKPADAKKVGYRDGRSGVEFPQGFRIFRTFKGKERWAVAQDGVWVMDNNFHCTSLNKLSARIGAPTENAWHGWYYMDGSKKRLISDLRDPATIAKRS